MGRMDKQYPAVKIELPIADATNNRAIFFSFMQFFDMNKYSREKQFDGYRFKGNFYSGSATLLRT